MTDFWLNAKAIERAVNAMKACMHSYFWECLTINMKSTINAFFYISDIYVEM